MIYKVTFCICLLNVVAFSSFSQTTGEEIINHFFQVYKKDPSAAIDDFFGKNKWISGKKDDVTNLKVQLKNWIDLVGEYHGYELITEKTIGNSLKLYSYLVKYDREPIRFMFLLYKASDTWQPQTFSFNRTMDDELEEAAKAYRLKENY
jgi:hypothetical protein